jgi:acyl-CoA synthetase (NDP forming)/RimJ/RimL family protein N-acetyltransferase
LPAVAESHGEVDVALRDGRLVHIRRIGPRDEAAIQALLERMSARSLWFRFFSGGVDVEAAARAAVAGDAVDGVVAISGAPAAFVGHAMLAVTADDRAEVAFEVAEDFQGQGVATLLLGRLVALARARGITTLTAIVLPENHAMIQVFRASGFAVQVHAEPGELHVELATDVGADARHEFDERDRVATVAAVAHFLDPGSVALIGASRRPDSVGGALARNLRESFSGPLHVISRAETVTDVEGDVELAVVAVPGDQIEAVARDCAAKGVKGLLVVSAGFEDAAGVDRRRSLAALCRANGMRLVGPNCLGVATSTLNATFARRRPLPGRVALVSQSGGVAIAALEGARAHGIGFSGFASIGDRADLSSNDFLQYWERDPGTDVIALYLESFGNPRRFARIASRVGRTKPVIAVKAGRTRSGARAAGTHTGALVSGSDTTVDALFAQAGVLRTDTYADLLDLAAFLSVQPAPAGPRVGVVTNAGGPAILFADAAEASGLQLPELQPATRKAMRALLPEAASPANPLDTLGDATAARFSAAVTALADDPGVDALAVLYVPTPPLPPEAAAGAVVDGLAAAMRKPPVVTAFLTEAAAPALLREAGIPAFPLPEAAARTLGAAAQRGRWLAAEPSPTAAAPGGVARDAAAALIADSLAAGGGWLAPGAVRALAAHYGLPLAEQAVARTAAAAADAAKRFGGPVALKAIAPGLTHKSDAGGVKLGLRTAAEVRRAAREVAETLRACGHSVEGFLVQPMADDGVELLVGLATDPVFGPVVACAAGGTATELLADVAVRLAPLSEEDLGAMPRELATFPLLTGHRGAPPADLEAVADVLRRVSALADDLPAIAEIDCNPVIAGPLGATIVDMRVRVAPPAPWPSDGVLGR